MLQCHNSLSSFFIDKQLSIHYSYNHMTHLPGYKYILEYFEPVPPPPHLQYNHHSRKSISYISVPKMHASRIFKSVDHSVHIKCITNTQNHILKSIPVIQSIPVHSGKRTHPNYINCNNIKEFKFCCPFNNEVMFSHNVQTTMVLGKHPRSSTLTSN